MKTILIIFIKEMRSIIRDKKMFFFNVFLPMLLVPSILFIIDFSMKNNSQNFSKNINISLSYKDNLFCKFLEKQENVKILDLPKEGIKSGKISRFYDVDEKLDEKIVKGLNFELNSVTNTTSLNSIVTNAIINDYETNFRELCKKINDFIYKYDKISYDEVADYITSYKVPIEGLDFKEQNDISNIYFDMLVPMMIILYCCIGTTGYACEATVGEKERGTLEPLLSTGVSRFDIVSGKLLSTAIMGVISALSTVLGLCFYKFMQTDNSLDFSLLVISILLSMVMACSILFSSVNLMIGIFSKSSKEAQMLMMPVSIICLVPTYFTFFSDLSNLPNFYFHIPVLNIVCVIKELLVGMVVTEHIIITFLWILIYILITSFLTFRMFNKEKVIFRM